MQVFFQQSHEWNQPSFLRILVLHTGKILQNQFEKPSPLLSSPYQSSPLKGDGGLSLLVEHLKVLISRACLRILSMAALTVEHLKVMAALTVEPACAFNLLIGSQISN